MASLTALPSSPGFGSTYEGLKRGTKPPEMSTRGRFGSTYEGLKPGYGSGGGVPSFGVLAVPMRA